MLSLLTTIALAAAPLDPAPAHGAQAHGAHAPAAAPADERAAGLREGRGMGMATPAERNGYPGPRHVLELASSLSLTPDQHARTRRLFDRMEARAQSLGAELLAAEAELDRLFAERRADRTTLEAAVQQVAAKDAALKLVHLETHLEMTALLSPEQIRRYVELRRGHGSSAHPAGH